MQLGLLVGQVPGHGAAPVMGNHAGGALVRAFQCNQGGKIIHQIFGAVVADGRGLAGAAIAAQIGRHAAVAAAELLKQPIPDESAFGEAVQKQQQGLTRLAADTAFQFNPCGQGMHASHDHEALLFVASGACKISA